MAGRFVVYVSYLGTGEGEMTGYSRWAVRVSLGYLLVGFTIGALMLVDKGFNFFPNVIRLLPLHMEYLMFGWFIHLIFGVAYWMFPRFTPSKTDMDHPRGFVRAAWGALIVLNIGLLIFTASYFTTYTARLRLTGRLFELVAIICFMINLWPRVKPISKPG